MQKTLNFTMAEFVEAVHRPPHPNALQVKSTEESPRRTDFTGTKTYNEALQLLKTGWADGLRRIKQKGEQVKKHIPSNSLEFSPSYDVSGSEVDVGRFLSGEPECMIDYTLQRTNRNGRIVTVMFNCWSSNAISSSDLLSRGTAAMRIVDSLESSGFRCEIIVGGGFVTETKNKGRIYILAKDADQHIEMDRLAFMFSHPSFLRRLCFRLLEQLSPEDQETYGNSKSGCRYPDSVREEKPNTVYIESMHSGYLDTPEKINEFVNSTLSQYLEVAA